MERVTGVMAGKMLTKVAKQITNLRIISIGWSEEVLPCPLPLDRSLIILRRVKMASTSWSMVAIRSFYHVPRSCHQKLIWASLKNTAFRYGTWCTEDILSRYVFTLMCRHRDLTASWSSRHRAQTLRTATTGSIIIRLSRDRLTGTHLCRLVLTWFVYSFKVSVACPINPTLQLTI